MLQIPSITTMITTVASIIGSIVNMFMSPDLQESICSKFGALINSFLSQMTLVIEEFHDGGLDHDQLFKAAEMHLRTVIPQNTQTLKVSVAPKQREISFSMEKYQPTIDTFNGVTYKWELVSKDNESRRNSSPRLRCFNLSFHQKHRDCAFKSYLPHLLNLYWKDVEQEDVLQEGTKTLKLFTLVNNGMGGSCNEWISVRLDHPATFDTLAMDLEMKRAIMDDLATFIKSKEFYRTIGKAWKRGYLLYGPPGTGKSSLVAAMANYLKFDIYDLDFTNILDNSQLRSLMLSTANRSMIVVEDIDRAIELDDGRRAAARAMDTHHGLEERNQITLSGLLNLVDGLWSCCGDEQIIIFTTNHKDRLDPALLRPGRMDVHIHMSYCTPSGFRTLASNYLGITQHALFTEVEQLISLTMVTPAEICEQLMKGEDPDIALRRLIVFLQEKMESDETRASEMALGPSEATRELNGNEVQS